MVGAGLDEAMPSPFLAPDAVAKTGLSSANVVHLLNPLAIEESVLRPSLRSGLLTRLPTISRTETKMLTFRDRISFCSFISGIWITR